jgi:phosphoenolpyruvate carboxykinase (ATP)
MTESTQSRHAAELEAQFGLKGVELRINLSKDELFAEAIANDRGRVTEGGPDDAQKAFPTKLGVDGPLVYYTDPTCTGRPVKDTFGVAHPELEDKIWWKPDFQKFDPAKFDALFNRVVAHLNENASHLYVKDVYCGTDPSYARPYRLVSEYATHNFFCHNMFNHGIEGVEDEDGKRWTMINAPSFHCDPERDGTPGKRIACLDFKNRRVLVAGRADYCGVVKKSMFTVMNYLLPEMGEMSMHCSANVGEGGDGAILFGLSGTGKTTLSADAKRKLIGDDEHAWTGNGVSNLEGGCYAKLINLDKDDEPVIAARSQVGRWRTCTPMSSTCSTTAAPRTPASPTRWMRTPTSCLAPRARTHRPSCCSPPMPSVCCRRSLSWTRRMSCTTSSPASPPSWPVPKSA